MERLRRDVRRVRVVDVHEHEERPLVLLVPAQPGQHLPYHLRAPIVLVGRAKRRVHVAPVHKAAVQRRRGAHVGVVRDAHGRVPQFSQLFADRGVLLAQAFMAAVGPMGAGVVAGHHRGVRGQAPRRRRDVAFEHRALGRQAVQGRRHAARVTVGPQVVGALGVHDDPQDVRASGHAWVLQPGVTGERIAKPVQVVRVLARVRVTKSMTESMRTCGRWR